MQLQLNESASVTLDATGAGVARLGPRRAGVQWAVRKVTISSTSATSQVPTAELFLGEPSGTPLDSTYDGNRNSTDVDVSLWSGQYLSLRWAGGTPGATGTLAVLGDNVIGEG